MPYIDRDRRKVLLSTSVQELASVIDDPGDINFVISWLIWRIWKKQQRYKQANMLVGVLEAVKLEFYRRQVADYEDFKRDVNGELEV